MRLGYEYIQLSIYFTNTFKQKLEYKWGTQEFLRSKHGNLQQIFVENNSTANENYLENLPSLIKDQIAV